MPDIDPLREGIPWSVGQRPCPRGIVELRKTVEERKTINTRGRQ